MNLARKGKVFGLALVAGLFVTTVATMQAQSEPNVAGSDLVGSYSGDYYPTAKSHLAATINLNITEVVGDHVKGTFLLVPPVPPVGARALVEIIRLRLRALCKKSISTSLYLRMTSIVLG